MRIDTALGGNLAPYLGKLTRSMLSLINEGYYLNNGRNVADDDDPMAWAFISRDLAIECLIRNESITSAIKRRHADSALKLDQDLIEIEDALRILSAPPTYNHS